jgi:hypothetical protein
MTTNYDSIAEQYKRASQQPWRAPVEAYTLMKLIGDPAAKVVIDVACGEGFYTGMIRRRDAAHSIQLRAVVRLVQKVSRNREIVLRGEPEVSPVPDDIVDPNRCSASLARANLIICSDKSTPVTFAAELRAA